MFIKFSPLLSTETYAAHKQNHMVGHAQNITRLKVFQGFIFEKYLIFRQSFVNMYYALAHLTLGIEPMDDAEEDDGNSTKPETGDETDQGASNGGDTLTTDDDTSHVNGEAGTDDEGTVHGDSGQGKEPKQEL